MTADEIARLRKLAEAANEPGADALWVFAYVGALDPPTCLRFLDERDALIAYLDANEHGTTLDVDVAKDRLRVLGLIGGES